MTQIGWQFKILAGVIRKFSLPKKHQTYLVMDWASTGINVYTEWIETQLEDMHANIVDALDDFKTIFPDPSNVVLNYAGELTGPTQPGTPATVTGNDIQTIINAVQPVSWIDEVADF